MKRAAKEMAGFWKWIIGAILGTVIGAIADLKLPDIFSRMINVGVQAGAGDYIIRAGLEMFLVAVLSVGGAILSAYCASMASTGFSRKMRYDFFGKVQTFTQSELSDFGVSTLITRNTNDINQVQMFMLAFMRIVVRSPILMIGGARMAYQKNPSLAMPLLVSLPLILILVTIFSRKIMPLFLSLQKKVDRVNLVLREQISGIRVIRAFVNEDFEEERFDGANSDLSGTMFRLSRMTSLMGPMLMLTMNLTAVAILWISGAKVEVGGVAVGDVLAIIQYTMQIMFSLVMMAMMFVMYPRASASATRINEVLDRVPDIQDPDKSHLVSMPESKRGTVEFENVTFTFPGAEKPSLENISFSSKVGETTAIIGGTGSGKSTILNLIVRFFDATEGTVRVNGVDVRQLSQQELRECTGYVTQKAQLFSGTIADNLRYGNRDATMAELTEAARIAQALEFIEGEEGQFEAHVAQGGTNFSGGQKQRLSIARALVRNPEIYLFDDSFSALDAATDLKLRQALHARSERATMIIVAQRISSILQADRIIVMDEGRIVGMGTHAELLKTNEVYQEIAASQFSEEEVAENE